MCHKLIIHGRLSPFFVATHCTTAAGNSSGFITALRMSTAERADQLGLKPMGRTVSFAWVGAEPELMGTDFPYYKKGTAKSRYDYR